MANNFVSYGKNYSRYPEMQFSYSERFREFRVTEAVVQRRSVKKVLLKIS